MLDFEVIFHTEIDRSVSVFNRDGFVIIRDALTPDQLALAQSGTRREMANQMAEIPVERANRGYARYSFNQQRIHLPEWYQLIDLPTILPILEQVWGSSDYICIGAGGDYSTPGAKIQPLHSDLSDLLNDPLSQVKIQDVPTPYVAVNFLMAEFKAINGAIRFVPGTHRSRKPIPKLEDEPDWMKSSIVCAPAGTVIIRDVRCWHGGTANNSDKIRPMLDVLYLAPWFRLPHMNQILSRPSYENVSPRAQSLCRFIVED